MATRAQIDAQVRAQSALVDRAVADLRTFWRALPLSDPERARDLLMEFMPALVDKYGQAAGFAAAEFYDTLRADAATKRAFSAIVADADLDGVRASTRRLAGVLFGDNPETMLSGLGAVVDKQVKQVYRDTITKSATADPDASGWAREVRGEGCPFCRMLATRGAVYKRDTADFASHHHCKCAAVPEWGDAPEVTSRQYVASRRTSAMSDEQKRIHRERVRSYLADMDA